MKFIITFIALSLLSCSFGEDRELNNRSSLERVSIDEADDYLEECKIPKYLPNYSKLIPLPAYFNLSEATECAKLQNDKPILVVFDAIGSTKSKQMSNTTFSDKSILKYISDNYILTCLYTDDKTKLEEKEYYTSNMGGSKEIITTEGRRNIELQFEKTQSGSQPYFVVLDREGNVINNALSFTKDADFFLEWLQGNNNK